MGLTQSVSRVLTLALPILAALPSSAQILKPVDEPVGKFVVYPLSKDSAEVELDAAFKNPDPKSLPVVRPMGTTPGQTPERAAAVAESMKAACKPPPKPDPKTSIEGIDIGKPEIPEGCGQGGGVQTLDYEGPDSCVDGEKVVCAYDHVYHVGFYPFHVPYLARITATTSNFDPIIRRGFQSIPDTLIYLIHCSNYYSCASGEIVDIDDDGNTDTPHEPFDSKIVYDPTETGWYALIVMSYYQGREGFADVNLSYGSSSYDMPHEVFGGYHVLGKEVRSRDSFFVGKNSNSPVMETDPEYHDSTLFVLSTTATWCYSPPCGSFLFNDDRTFGNTWLLQSKVDLPDEFYSYNARVVVGVYSQWRGSELAEMNARLMHYRRHEWDGGDWTGADQKDEDGDGLSAEIERQVGSCDTQTPAYGNVGIDGCSCWCFGNLMATWGQYNYTPRDSDNDGLQDDWEVHGGVVSCEHPPQGPYFDAGECTPLSLHHGQYCPSSYCAALDLASLSGPDPAVYDIYMANNYWSCTGTYCAGDHGASNSHEATPEQQETLAAFWHDDPLTCWDGSSPPCDDPNADLPYRAQMHAYNGDALSFGPSSQSGGPMYLPDDSFNEELNFDGSIGAASYFDARFGGAYRYARIFRYSLATHYATGGQAFGVSERVLVWGNDGQPRQVTSTFSHETGHLLGLDDISGGNPCDNDPPCDEAINRNLSPPSAVCTDVFMMNPVPASVMNYGYGAYGSRGLRPKSLGIPERYDDEEHGWFHCDLLNLRFSKGLLDGVHEDSLRDLYLAPTWKTKMLVQNLFCFNDLNVPGYISVYRYPGTSGPYCDPERDERDINWDALRPPPPPYEPYAWDISHGHFPESETCDGDVLQDVNEWMTILAHGKDGLTKPPYTIFPIYLDTFNSGTVANIAGWDLPITSTVTFGLASYPQNLCDSAQILYPCTEHCVTDECVSSNDCKGTALCSNGVCTCSGDEDCYSAWCVGGFCRTDFGACSCDDPGDCVDSVCPADGVCNSTRSALDPPPGNLQAPRESAFFQGTTPAPVIRISNTGNDSPLSTVGGIEDAFTLWFEFRFQGFAQGQTRQVLFHSGSFEAAITQTPGGNLLELTVGSGTLSWYIDVHRWYKVIWAASAAQGDHLVKLWAWDYHAGQLSYSIGSGISGCIWRSLSGGLAATGDVWIGYDGANSATHFRGEIDNVGLYNYRSASLGSLRPTGPNECAEQ